MASGDASTVMSIVVHPDVAALHEAVAGDVAARVREAVAVRGRCVLVLAGGSTPRGVYQRLATHDLPWRDVVMLFGDERAVGPDDPASNYRMAVSAFAAALGDESDRPTLRRIAGELGAQEAAAQYAIVVAETCGDAPFDVVMLGMGDDGHVASIFPGHDEGLGDVVATTSPLPPFARVSLGLARLRNARVVLMVVSGAGKAARLADVVGQISRREPLLPAAKMALAEVLVWHVDADAARFLSGADELGTKG